MIFLRELLNFERAHNCQEIEAQFIRAARIIITEYEMVRSQHVWCIQALELYFDRHGVCEDGTVHGPRFKEAGEQLRSCTWYVHRGGKLPPKRLGIDITAGSESKKIHAGLLIAALGEFDGSGRAVKAILRGVAKSDKDWRYNDDERNLLKRIHGEPVDSAVLSLRRRKDKRDVSSLWIGPRKLGKNAKVEDAGRLLRVSVSNFRWLPACCRELQLT